MVVRVIVVVWLAAMLAMLALACGGNCTGFCNNAAPTVILEAQNRLVTSVSSSCGNVHLAGSDVVGELLHEPETCHVEVLLADGEHFAFDIPFTEHIDDCCCKSCIEGFDAVWQTVDASAPTPLPDASPFPPSDAGDTGETSTGDAD